METLSTKLASISVKFELTPKATEAAMDVILEALFDAHTNCNSLNIDESMALSLLEKVCETIAIK